MIGVDEIEDILKVTVYSGAVEGEKPLSVALIASVGSGKTSMLKKTSQKPVVFKKEILDKGKKMTRTVEARAIVGSVLYTTNSTPYVLYTHYGHELKTGQIKHVAIGDFLNILNLPKYQLGGVITFYNNIIEEGIMAIESRDGQFVSEVPVTVGLITAISQQDFLRRREDWGALGFLSRVLPVSFRYSDLTAGLVRESIKSREYLKELQSFDIILPKPMPIRLDKVFADEIEKIALRTRDSNDELGARRLKQLQTFAMASALMNARDAVKDEDVDKLKRYEKYFNTRCTALI